ncbi:MAG TPA: hypothetical protein VFG04_24170 [Planctomycetaceae bacterium]|nr:hypothetical protein [Planctomycetaceae bacterium]
MSLTTLVAWLIGVISAAADQPSYSEDLSKWSENSALQEDSEQWRRANWSQQEWVVFLRDGHPAVRARKQDKEPGTWADEQPKLPFAIKQGRAKQGSAGRVYAAKVPDGWIIAFNAGEFGGGLWWYAPDGQSRYMISYHRVQGFLQTDQGLLALEGLAHLGSDRGEIIQISRGANGKWMSERVVNLGSAPDAATRDKDGSLIVVTTKGLLRFRMRKPLETLLDHGFWGGLYPNSVIIDSTGTVYVGMREGVAKVALTKGQRTVTWLLPK